MSLTAPDAASSTSTGVGAEVRRRRLDQGRTMQEVATAAGLSQPFLSQVERGRARPSMRSLDAIAQALGTSAVSLLAAGVADHTPVAVVRAADREELVQTEAAPGSAATLASAAGRDLRAVEFVGGPRELHERPFVHANEELSVVLAGRFCFDVDGALHDLRPGDTISVAGGVAHRYRVVGRGPHRLLVVLLGDDLAVVPRGDGEPTPHLH